MFDEELDLDDGKIRKVPSIKKPKEIIHADLFSQYDSLDQEDNWEQEYGKIQKRTYSKEERTKKIRKKDLE